MIRTWYANFECYEVCYKDIEDIGISWKGGENINIQVEYRTNQKYLQRNILMIFRGPEI